MICKVHLKGNLERVGVAGEGRVLAAKNKRRTCGTNTC